MVRKIKKKILFGITSLTLGGAERALVDLSNELLKKYDITIFTIYGNGDLVSELNKKIRINSLYNSSYNEYSKLKKIAISLKILLCKKMIYNKYIKGDFDCEISFLEGPITRLFSHKNKNCKKVTWVHSDISKIFGEGISSKIKKIYDKKIYQKYDNIVFVSEDNRNKFKQIYTNVKSDKLKVIHNYVGKDLIINKADEVLDIQLSNKKNFVTVCRLVEAKALSRLVKVHSNLIKNGFYHTFYVVGDGPKRDELEKLIQDENVTESFILLGKKDNPYPFIKQADYFCLLSKYEGYPMVIEEAKVLGKRIIITDTAARECLVNYSNSLIVDNSEIGIFKGLADVISDKYNFKNNVIVNDENKIVINKIIELVDE